MLDDFFIRSIIGGIGVAMVVGPLGCFVIWRRLSYFGDTLSHSALLGVALALLLQINITLSVFITSILVATALLLLQRAQKLSSDTLLGLLAHSSIALGLIALSFMTWVRVDLMGFLFGDILSITKTDIFVIWIGGLIILCLLILMWRQLFAATVSVEISEAEGLSPHISNFIFTVMLALVIAISMKIVGVMLLTALLIIPAASARNFSTSPEQMAVIATFFGICSVLIGLYSSLNFDFPAGPSIIVGSLLLFLITISKNLFFSRMNN